MRWLESTLPAPPHSIPYQWADEDELGVSAAEAAERVWLIETDRRGRMHQYGGYLAVSVLLRRQPGFGYRFIGILMDTPPFSFVSGLGYTLIARYRHRLPGGTPACAAGPRP